MKKSLSLRLSERFNKILETSRGRVYQHLTKGNPFVLISACRGDKTDEENKERTKQLRKDIREHDFGFSKAIGGYNEVQINGISKDVLENSVIILSTPDREDELRELAIELGSKYSQDSILLVDSKGKSRLIYTRDIVGKDGTILKKFGSEDTEKGNFHPMKKKSKPFTRIKGKDFSIIK